MCLEHKILYLCWLTLLLTILYLVCHEDEEVEELQGHNKDSKFPKQNP